MAPVALRGAACGRQTGWQTRCRYLDETGGVGHRHRQIPLRPGRWGHFVSRNPCTTPTARERWRRSFTMTRRCELTGKLPLSGQLRSHAENATKRKFRPNLCEVTLISDALGRKFRLRVSAHALKS